MRNIKEIRKIFLKKFNDLIENEKIIKVPRWLPQPFEEDTIIVKLVSEEIKRVFTVEEFDDDEEILSFSAFTSKTGLYREYDELYITARDTIDFIDKIFYLYKLWFVEKIDTKEMDKIIDEMFKRYNPDYKDEK